MLLRGYVRRRVPIMLLFAAVAAPLSGQSNQSTSGSPPTGQQVEELRRMEEEIQNQLDRMREEIRDAQLSETSREAFELRLDALAIAQAAIRQQVETLRAAIATRPEPETTAPVPPELVPPAPATVISPGLTPFDLTGQVVSGTAFNPSISVIPDFAYSYDSVSGEGSNYLSNLDGFRMNDQHGNDDADDHAHGVLNQGFNLRETELAFSAAVDPYFDAVAIANVSGEGLEVEEVYGRTRFLPGGFQLKLGQFFSGIGYINSQHPHQWDFINQNLAYEGIFGGNLSELGMQLSWLPRLPVYALFGVEAFQGENAGVAQYHGSEEEDVFTRKAGPRLFTGFFKLAPDLGYSNAAQFGLFGGRSRTHQAEHEEGPLEGHAWFLGTEWVYKYDSPAPFGYRDFTLQAEYIYRVRDLQGLAEEVEIGLAGEHERFSQDGFYLQGVYGIAPRVSAAARFDAAGRVNRIERSLLPIEKLQDSRRWSLNLTVNPTHFSRVRVQFDRNSLAVGGQRLDFNQLSGQLQLSLGVHGAHRF
jgi:hypothetical protein